MKTPLYSLACYWLLLSRLRRRRERVCFATRRLAVNWWLSLRGRSVASFARRRPGAPPHFDSGAEMDPYFSPDGSQIAFSATVAGNIDVYVVQTRVVTLNG